MFTRCNAFKELGVKIFKRTAEYDSKIFEYLSKQEKNMCSSCQDFSQQLNFSFNKKQALRYGENPHQKAALYHDPCAGTDTLVCAQQLSGKELSFNNFLDLNAAWDIVREFDEPAAVVIKHLNPTGVAIAKDLKTAYTRAWSADTLSAFGGIIGLNKNVDMRTAKKISTSGFLECVIAPEYDNGAFKIAYPKKEFSRIKT